MSSKYSKKHKDTHREDHLLFTNYVEQYNFLKMRLSSMKREGNPVIEDNEYISLLLNEIEELKDDNIKLRMELSVHKYLHQLPFYKKLILWFKGEI